MFLIVACFLALLVGGRFETFVGYGSVVGNEVGFGKFIFILLLFNVFVCLFISNLG